MENKDYDLNELEEILKRVRQNDMQEEADEPDELAPPVVYSQDEEPDEDELEWHDADEETKTDKPKVKFDKEIVKINFKTRLLPKLKAFAKKVFTRQFFVAVVSALVIAGLAFGGVKLYQYSKIAYLKPYIEKYNIEFPEGILEEFCDEYGRDQTVAGRLTIEDTTTDVIVTGISGKTKALMEKGSTVLENQHVRSIALDGVDLESFYSTPEKFVTSSQKVNFKTLFGDEEYQIVAVYYANTNPDNDDGYVFPYNAYGNMTERSFKSYIDRVKTRSLFYTGVEMPYDAYYLSINTPTDTVEDSRFVLLCKRTDDGFEKVIATTENERIRHTQKWYDEQGEENPYRLASDWYPEIYADENSDKTVKLSESDFDYEAS